MSPCRPPPCLPAIAEPPAAEFATAEAAALARRAECGRPQHKDLKYTRAEPSARTKQLLDVMSKARPSLSEAERARHLPPEAHQYDKICKTWDRSEETVREADSEIGAWAAVRLVDITLDELRERSTDGRLVRHRDVFEGIFDDGDEEKDGAGAAARAAVGAVVGAAAPSHPRTERHAAEQLRKRLRKECREKLERGLESLGVLTVPADAALVSHKVRVLAAHLKAGQPGSTLVFTTKRLTARLLAETLEHHAELLGSMLGQLGEAGTRGEKRVDFVVGVGKGASASGVSTNAMQQQDRLEQLKNKQDRLRVLVCTDVLLEGTDVQSCDCVVRFDPAKSHVNYVQAYSCATHTTMPMYHVPCTMYHAHAPSTMHCTMLARTPEAGAGPRARPRRRLRRDEARRRCRGWRESQAARVGGAGQNGARRVSFAATARQPAQVASGDGDDSHPHRAGAGGRDALPAHGTGRPASHRGS